MVAGGDSSRSVRSEDRCGNEGHAGAQSRCDVRLHELRAALRRVATNSFIPYWNQAVLVVEPARGTVLVAGLSERVAGWIRDTSRLDDIICTQDFGAALAKRLRPPSEDGLVRSVSSSWRAFLPEFSPLCAKICRVPRSRMRRILLDQVIADDQGDGDPAELCLAERTITIARAAIAAAVEAASSGDRREFGCCRG